MRLVIVFLLASLFCRGQISDFTTDSCYFSQSLSIINRTITDTSCIEEFGYTLGGNELIVFGLRTVNMGQHDAGIVNALDTTGLFFDECHYHYHVKDWNNVYLLNSCRDTVAKGAKVGYNLMDGGNVIQAINVGFMSCFGDWISQYGPIDYSLGVHPPNDDFNGDVRMGLSAGYLDSYSPSTYGNSIKIESVSNGVYSLVCAGNFSRYFNQGLNVFPDGFEVVVTISGVHPNRSISVGGVLPECCDNSNPLPSTITLTSTGAICDSTGACVYPFERLLIKGNSYQVKSLPQTTNVLVDNPPALGKGEFYAYRIGSLQTRKFK